MRGGGYTGGIKYWGGGGGGEWKTRESMEGLGG